MAPCGAGGVFAPVSPLVVPALSRLPTFSCAVTTAPSLAKDLVPAGVISVIVRVDKVADRFFRERGDRSLDLVMERRELAVDHDDSVRANRGCDVAPCTLDHIGLPPKIGCLHLHLGEVRLGSRLPQSEKKKPQDPTRRRNMPHENLRSATEQNVACERSTRFVSIFPLVAAGDHGLGSGTGLFAVKPA